MGRPVDWASVKEDLCFNGVTPVYFWKSFWEKFDPEDVNAQVSVCYLLYRFFFMLWFIAGYLQRFCKAKFAGPFYFIFLTNQTFVIQTTYSVIYFTYLTWVFVKRKRRAQIAIAPEPRTAPSAIQSDQVQVELEHVDLPADLDPLIPAPKVDKPPIMCKILWILISLLQVAPYFVTAGFWLIVAKEEKFEGLCQQTENYLVHAFNSIAAFIDSMVMAVPSRAAHAIVVMIYAVYYGLFTFLYEKWNGQYPYGRTYIYSIINWRHHPGGTIITLTISLFVAAVGFLIFGYGLYHLKILIRDKFCIRAKHQDTSVPLQIESAPEMPVQEDTSEMVQQAPNTENQV